MIAKADAIRIETGAGMATGTVVLLEAERGSIVATGTGSGTIAVAGIAMTSVIRGTTDWLSLTSLSVGLVCRTCVHNRDVGETTGEPSHGYEQKRHQSAKQVGSE